MKRATLRASFLAVGLIGSHAALAADPPAPPAPAPTGPGPIAALQQQLKDQGFAPGPVNGVMTEQTRRALAAYERRTGRPPEALGAGGPGGDPVRHAQAVLQRLGLLAGPIDGDLGPATRDAIIRFEAARHLAIDPRVSDSLLAALGEAAAGATAESSPPAPPPAPSAAAAPPAGATPPAASQTAAEALAEAPSGATGRQPLPPGASPPPIR